MQNKGIHLHVIVIEYYFSLNFSSINKNSKIPNEKSLLNFKKINNY